MIPNILTPPGPGVPPETTEINRDFSGLLTSPVDYLKSGSFNLAFQGLTKQLKILLSFAPRTKVTQSTLLLLSHKIAISLWTLPLWLQNDKSQQPTSDTKPQVAFRDQGEVSLHRRCSCLMIKLFSPIISRFVPCQLAHISRVRVLGTDTEDVSPLQQTQIVTVENKH